MKVKSLVTSILCTLMLFSTVSYAENTISIKDEKDFFVASSTKSMKENVFSEFPMSIDKTIENNMEMSLHFWYEKDIATYDAVRLVITDYNTGDTVLEKELTESDNYAVLNSVENDRTYIAVVDEIKDGEESHYGGLIKTKYDTADFPVNMTIAGNRIANNQGETFNFVAIKKVEDRILCTHSEDEECNEDCEYTVDKIMPNELDSFYGELDSNSLYEIQVNANKNGKDRQYRAYISTYPDGADLGIFTRGFAFLPISDENSIESAEAKMSSDIRDGENEIQVRKTYDDYGDFDNTFKYVTYQELVYSPLYSTGNTVIEWVVPEQGDYWIETVGNLDTKIYMFWEDSKGNIVNNPTLDKNGGVGENARVELNILAGEKCYFVVEIESGGEGKAGFRIVRNPLDSSYGDGISGYYSDLQKLYQKNNYSNIKNPNCKVAYNGDVNVFVYDVKEGEGWLEFNNVETPLSVKIESITGLTDGIDDKWTETTFIVPANVSQYLYKYNFQNFTNNMEYEKPDKTKIQRYMRYITIKQVSVLGANDSGYYTPRSYAYGFNFYDSKCPDILAANSDTKNSTPFKAYDLTNELPYESRNQLTINKGTGDWFKFTTGDAGGDLEIVLGAISPSSDNQNVDENGIASDAAYTYQYRANVYSSVQPGSTEGSWKTSKDVGTTVSYDGYSVITCENLIKNNTYYIKISTPKSTQYSSFHTYDLDINVKTPRAVLSSNVELQKNLATEITDLSGFLNTIMENMVCYVGTDEISDSEALTNVELFYNNELLTADTVNAMGVGTYPITVKYKGVEATGGVVTLSVAQSSDVVEVPVEAVAEGMNEYDWLQAAKTLANVRLLKEGREKSTLLNDDVADSLGIDVDNPVRGTLYKTLQATYLFYTNGTSKSGTTFIRATNAGMVTEEQLYSRLSDGNVVVMQLGDVTDKTNVSKMRYVVICGVDKTSHKVKIYDPLNVSELLKWYDTSVLFDGGYVDGDSNIKFTGSVIYNG